MNVNIKIGLNAWVSRAYLTDWNEYPHTDEYTVRVDLNGHEIMNIPLGQLEVDGVEANEDAIVADTLSRWLIDRGVIEPDSLHAIWTTRHVVVDTGDSTA